MLRSISSKSSLTNSVTIPTYYFLFKEDKSILIEQKISSLEEEITKIKNTLKTLPEGKLIVSKNGGYTKFYVSDGHSCTYISKKNTKLLEQLAYKKYLELRLEQLMLEIKSLSSINQDMKQVDKKITNYLVNPSINELIKNYRIIKDPSYSEWMHQPFVSNPKYPETKTQRSINGLVCRSKSESLIAIALTNHGIPFRYECLFENEYFDYYPDFTIIHPATGKFFYWEHLGRLDQPSYIEEMRQKLLLLCKKGIFLGENLILTFEINGQQLSYGTIENLIHMYFY